VGGEPVAKKLKVDPPAGNDKVWDVVLINNDKEAAGWISESRFKGFLSIFLGFFAKELRLPSIHKCTHTPCIIILLWWWF
jgi:hypothetical protein